ncbi:IS66 family transposase [Clostridium amylolyticum]|uniref:IS66 family transposase n=1 Tax=Clostridium amylolyticum TaxID=1121298 RepID=UPI00311A76A8
MNNEIYDKKQLTEYSKNALITMYLAQQEALKKQEKQMEDLNKKLDLLLEQIRLSNQNKFGRSTEKIENAEQLTMCFNEAEVTIEQQTIQEPAIEQVIPEHKRRVKPKGKRQEDLSSFPVRIEEHLLSEEKLQELFCGSYRRLPDEVYRKLEFHPATFEVVEHHVAVYCGNKEQTIVRADRPSEILKNSIVTPSLLAAIINSKYINAVPLYRLEQEFARYEVNVSRQVMANWVIRGSERYLSLLYDRMHQKLYDSKILHSDETPVNVIKDGRPAGSKSYMWVYRTGQAGGTPPAVLYEYQKTRKSDHPREFLKNYHGVVVCDGYQVYHKLEEERPDELKVAGCWAHARRRFANVCKSLGKSGSKGSLAETAVNHIALIYRTDNFLEELNPEERLEKRQLLVKPLVEAFFAWVKSNRDTVPPQSETGKGLAYCVNQEKYLRAFLDDPIIPLDNNAAEISIRSFCVGKHNWHGT